MRNEISTRTAAQLAAVPHGTLGAWLRRGYVETPGDLLGVLGLALVAALGRLGVAPSAAAGIVRAARPLWRAALAGTGGLLVAVPGADDGWHVEVRRRDEPPAHGTALVVDLAEIAGGVLVRLVGTRPRRRPPRGPAKRLRPAPDPFATLAG